MKNQYRLMVREWPHKSRKQKVYLICGVLLLILTAIGLMLPLVPQIPFAIMAAVCFSKGSPRIHKAIRNHPQLGPPVREWEDERSVQLSLKVSSSIMMSVGMAVAHWKLPLPWALFVDTCFAPSILFILTRRTAVPRPSSY